MLARQSSLPGYRWSYIEYNPGHSNYRLYTVRRSAWCGYDWFGIIGGWSCSKLKTCAHGCTRYRAKGGSAMSSSGSMFVFSDHSDFLRIHFLNLDPQLWIQGCWNHWWPPPLFMMDSTEYPLIPFNFELNYISYGGQNWKCVYGET